MDDWTHAYIGIPYADGGRDRYGCDCWGLVRLVLKERFGKEIPAFSYDAFDKKALAALISEKKPLVNAIKTGRPKAGTVVVMNVLGLPVHLGIMLDETRMLHTSRGKESRVERIGSVYVRNKIEGFYDVC